MAITKSNPPGSRATRLVQDETSPSATSTKWEIVPEFDKSFIITTTAAGAIRGSILASGLNFVDIWLPPSHNYTVRTRHTFKSGSPSAWTSRTPFVSRGPLNSFEKYLALSGISNVDNVLTGLTGSVTSTPPVLASSSSSSSSHSSSSSSSSSQSSSSSSSSQSSSSSNAL